MEAFINKLLKWNMRISKYFLDMEYMFNSKWANSEKYQILFWLYVSVMWCIAFLYLTFIFMLLNVIVATYKVFFNGKIYEDK